MNDQSTASEQDLFNHNLIASYVDSPRFVPLPWLAERVQAKLDDADCRFLLLTAEPGAGKTAFMTWLARRYPDCPRYFIRRDQRTPLGDVGARSLLLQIGCQLAATQPDLFTREQVEVAVEQRIGTVAETGQAIGAQVERIISSPFYQAVMQIQQQVKELKGNVIGIRVGEWITDPRLIPVDDLQYMALIDPALAMLQTHPDGRIVILIDALDELRYRPSQDTLLAWLATCPELPPNVRLVLSSRPDETLLTRFREAQQHWLRELNIAAGDPDLESALRSYASGLVAEPEFQATLGSAPAMKNFVNRVVEKADGNFGYLDAVGRGIDQALTQEDHQLLTQLVELSDLPGTLRGLYVFFLHQLKDITSRKSIEVEDVETGDVHYLSAWPAVYQRILGVLTVAREPLSLAQIRRFGAIAAAPEYLVEAMEYLRQFLDREGDGYRLYHSTIVELLTAESTKENPDTQDIYQNSLRSHSRIVTFYRKGTESWEDVDWRRVDDYGLLHLAEHLYVLRETEHFSRQLYQLICKPFMWEKQRRYGSHQPFATDVKLAIDMARAEEPPNLAHEVRGWLIYARLGTQASQIPPEILSALVRAGQAKKVMGFVSLIPDKEIQVEAYLLVSKALLERGERAEAGNALILAFSAVKALRILPGKGREGIRAAGFMRIALALLQAREFERALEVIGALDDEMLQARGLSAVTQAMSWAGDWVREGERVAQTADGLLIETEKIEDKSEKAQVLIGTASMLAQAGESTRAAEVANQALAVIDAIEDESTKAQVLLVLIAQAQVPLAQSLAQSGESRRAAEVADRVLTVAEAIEDQEPKLRILSALAQALVLIGENRRAVEVANRALEIIDAIEDELEKATVLNWIAQALAQAGERGRAAEVANQALEIADAIDDESEKADLRTILALTFIRVGESRRAAEVASQALAVKNAIEDESRNQHQLIGSADVQAGHFDRALELTETIEDELEKALALSVIAEALGKAGENSRAAEVANQALAAAAAIGTKQEDQHRVGMKRAIADALANVGEFERAQMVAEEAGVGLSEQDKEGVEIRALFLAQTGHFDRALELIAAIEDKSEKAQSLIGTASMLAQAGESTRAAEVANQALAVIDAIEEDEPRRAYQLFGIEQALALSGKFDRALELIAAIEDESQKVIALSGTALALAQAGETGRAAEIANRALEIAEAIKEVWQRAMALGPVALALAQAGETGRAVEVVNRTVAEMKSQSDSPLGSFMTQTESLMLATLALALAQAGETGRAVEVANRTLAEMKSQSGTPFEFLGGGMAMGQMGEILRMLVQAFTIAGEGKRAAEVADQMLAKVLGDDHYQSSIWGNYIGSAYGLARSIEVGGALMILDRAGLHELALSKWREQFAEVVSSGTRESYAHYTQLLEAGVPTIANIDEGQTLWNVYQAVMEVEDW
jgi:tetratricopeptide (TPR) repeat protein